MASGYGVNGGTGRCYSFWLDFTKCLADADFPADCKDFRDDYIECLHHSKERKRRVAIAKQLNEKKKQQLAEAAAAKSAPAAPSG